MTQEGKNSKEIYTEYYSKMYNIPYESFRGMLKKWKRKYYADNKYLVAGNLCYGYTPTRTTVQVDREGNVVQAWIKSHSSDNIYIELIEEIKKNTQPKEYTIEYKPEASGMLEIPLFDMHWGIATIEFYEPLLNDILIILDRKIYDEVNIIIGQDNFHNDNFNGTTTKGTQIEKVDMVKAWNDAKTFWYNIIDKAIERANRVKIIYSKGNHDKAICWAFMQMLKERYGDIVDDSLAERKCITYGTNFIGLTHGEFKKNKTTDLRSQFSVKFPMEFARSKVKEIHAGHLHTEQEKDEYGVMCRRLCAGNITDEWSDYEGYLGDLKRFMIFEWSLEKLVAIYYV